VWCAEWCPVLVFVLVSAVANQSFRSFFLSFLFLSFSFSFLFLFLFLGGPATARCQMPDAAVPNLPRFAQGEKTGDKLTVSQVGFGESGKVAWPLSFGNLCNVLERLGSWTGGAKVRSGRRSTSPALAPVVGGEKAWQDERRQECFSVSYRDC
jgi:hypothetical protein